MSITRSTVRKLEKKINDSSKSEVVVLPILTSQEKTEQLMREAKRQGKRLGTGIPLLFSSREELIKLWENV